MIAKPLAFLFLAGFSVVYAQQQEVKQVVKPVPKAQVETSLPKDVQEMLREQRKAERLLKKRDVYRLERGLKVDREQERIFEINARRQLEIEKKRLELLRELPPVYYNIEASGVVGGIIVPQKGLPLLSGDRIGIAEVGVKENVPVFYIKGRAYRLDHAGQIIDAGRSISEQTLTYPPIPPETSLPAGIGVPSIPSMPPPPPPPPPPAPPPAPPPSIQSSPPTVSPPPVSPAPQGTLPPQQGTLR